MLSNRLPCHVQVLAQLRECLRVVRVEHIEQLPAARIGQCSKQEIGIIHEQIAIPEWSAALIRGAEFRVRSHHPRVLPKTRVAARSIGKQALACQVLHDRHALRLSTVLMSVQSRSSVPLIPIR